MINKVISTIERHHMLKNGTTVIAAISGGADSMTLLSILRILQADYTLNLIAAHVNHGLRGAEADRDERFVREYCDKNSIDVRVLRTNVNLISSSSGEGIEECGRRIRYEFFNSIDSNAVIATAHTLSDSIETMIFNLVRGSTLKGLCSIPAIRCNIIRPLIECSRSEIEYFCKTNDLPYLVDSSNLQDNYMRNHIRLNIIPQFNRINPQFNNAFFRCSESLTLDEDLLNRLSDEIMLSSKTKEGYKTDILLNSHPALRKRVLAKILYEKTGVFSQFKHIEAVDLLLRREGSLQVQCGITVDVNKDCITFPQKIPEQLPWSIDFHEGISKIGERTVTIKIVNKKDLEKIQNVHNNILDNCFDYDKIIKNAVVRSRREGDKIRFRQRNCTKSIKKLFNENLVPLNERNNIAMIADSAGLIWVEGFGVSERCEVTVKTTQFVVIFI